MIPNILYIFLALFGIGFLIFIHELGHYFMARKVGIVVEVFSIGFGKAIAKWHHKGVEWKICWIPFGGYVKMAGMEKKENVEPSDVKNGYFGSKPWDRIKVAVMGPAVNIAFAFIAFAFLWMIGGRDKPFSDYTHYVGWVEEDSAPHNMGIRPGDFISKVNGRPFKGFQDFLYGAVLDQGPLTMNGYELDYETGGKKPFIFTFSSDPKVKGFEKAAIAINTLSASQYLIAGQFPEGSPLKEAGMQEGERIIWVDGELIFSTKQLIQTVNQPKVLLAIERQGRTFLAQVPRLQIRDLRLSTPEREELDDWRFEASLTPKVDELFYVPYNLNEQAVVEGPLSYIDEKSQPKFAFEIPDRSPMEIPLMPGDRIIAVQGKKIATAYQLLQEMQMRKVLVIAKKNIQEEIPLWSEADKDFIASLDLNDIEKITQTIGTDRQLQESGSLHLLQPVPPISIQAFPMTPKLKKMHEGQLESRQKAIEEIEDKETREEALKNFQLYKSRLTLGVFLQDKKVAYNPQPLALFGDVIKETYRTLFALFTGYLSPKNLSGPVGMVQVIHYGWSLGVKEALFWLGMISLNLGILNLLPIPILDGGHICFAILESFTKKPLKSKTMERLILPFVILFIILFIYLTYHDIARILKSLF